MVYLYARSYMSKRTWSDDELRAAVKINVTMAGTLRSLGLSTSPGNYKSLQLALRRLKIDDSHFKGRAHGTSVSSKTQRLEDVLIAESTCSNTVVLKARLFKAGLLENRCSKCGLDPSWQGFPLTLQLDHINGNPFDNRLANLRILCPNCHAQTKTFKGKLHVSRYKFPESRCVDCDRPVFRNSTRCNTCRGNHGRLVDWPEPSVLAEEVVRTSYVTAARRLGTSDSAVRKYLRKHLGDAPMKRKS